VCLLLWEPIAILFIGFSIFACAVVQSCKMHFADELRSTSAHVLRVK
jgi:hypothetical protein